MQAANGKHGHDEAKLFFHQQRLEKTCIIRRLYR